MIVIMQSTTDGATRAVEIGLAAKLFDGFADRTRLAILVELSAGEQRVTARVEAELDQRITPSLILQPRAEIKLAAQDVPRLGMGAGIDKVELGVRLRYEIIREFAPYIGIEQSWHVGGSADYARVRGEDPSATNYVVGIRFWF